MVFNTGAALLDSIVLAVVSREQEGTYGYIPLLRVRTQTTKGPYFNGGSTNTGVPDS